MPNLRVAARKGLEVDVQLHPHVEHIRHRRCLSCMSAALGLHGLPELRFVVSAQRLVSESVTLFACVHLAQ